MGVDRDDVFRRVRGRVTDLEVLERRLVVICGVGSVGSLVADELAKIGVRRMVLADGDHFEASNLARHHLTGAYIGLNKAEAMADMLTRDIPEMDVGAAPFHLDARFSDVEIDQFLAPADLVVVATDSREAQRRLASRAYALDVPCLVPALDPSRGGEVFVQLSSEHPCFQCWDGFRPDALDVRGVSAIEVDSYAVVQQTVWLAEALLDPRSPNVQELSPAALDPARRVRQLFVIRPGAALQRASVDRRRGCSGCEVGPSSVRELDSPLGDAPDGIARALTSGRERVEAAGWPLVLTGKTSPPEILSIMPAQTVVVEGETVAVSWRTRNATGVELDGVRRAPNGEARLQVTRTRTVSFAAVNPFGVTEAEPLVLRAIETPTITAVPVFTLGTPVSGVFGGIEARREGWAPPPPEPLPPLPRPSLSAVVGRRPRLSDLFRGGDAGATS